MHGHTTTFDCLWMGVLVVTLVGQTALGSCAGLSELMNLGLPEWVAYAGTIVYSYRGKPSHGFDTAGRN